MTTVDTHVLDDKVQQMYRQVAEQPHGSYHFEMGRPLAQRLGYSAEHLDAVPPESVESFAGVGHFFDLLDLAPGQRVLDLGSGSGMDTFVAARLVAPDGRVSGVDFTQEQLDKAWRLAAAAGVQDRVDFWQRRIEILPMREGEFDCVISNGVINLSADKRRVFDEIARVLKPGGQVAVADIVSERRLTEAIVCNADLWASCIGGAIPEDDYRSLMDAAGLEVKTVRPNDYGFISDQARGATTTYGVKSISVLAVKR
jgi:arsenite methyltransferase